MSEGEVMPGWAGGAYPLPSSISTAGYVSFSLASQIPSLSVTREGKHLTSPWLDTFRNAITLPLQ